MKNGLKRERMEYELFFIGLVISLIYIAVTGYYPGGIIVPGYLVLFADQPLRLLGTLVVSILTFLIYRLISRYLILFGRRRFVFMILAGAILALAFSLLLPHLSPEVIEFKVIGWVIPGLIAINLDRQGPLITITSMAIVLTVLWFISRLWFSII